MQMMLGIAWIIANSAIDLLRADCQRWAVSDSKS